MPERLRGKLRRLGVLAAMLVGLAVAFQVWRSVQPGPVLTPAQRAWLEAKGGLVVAGDNAFPPFEFVDSDGEYRGFNVDLMRALALELETDVTLRPLPWDQARAALERGEVDALEGIKYMPEREALYDFARPALVSASAIFVRRDRHDIAEIKDLRGNVVAVQRGDFAHDLLKNEPDVRLTLVENQERAVDTLLRGEADAFVGNKYAGLAFLHRKRVADQVKIVGEPIAPANYGMAVRAGNRALLDILNAGLASLERKGIRDRIYTKWFGASLEPAAGPSPEVLTRVAALLLLLLAFMLGVYTWNRILRQRVAARTRTLAALQQTSLQVSSSLDLTAVLESIAGSAQRLLNASRAYVFLWDAAAQRFTFAGGQWANGRKELDMDMPRPDGLTARVARSGQPMVIHDAPRHPLYQHPGQDYWHIGAIAGVPVRRGESVLGVLNLIFEERHRFSDEELSALRFLADQAAMAIHNARLYAESQRRADEMDRLRHVAEIINSTLDLDQVLHLILEQLGQVIKYDSASIMLLSDHTMKMVAARGFANQEQVMGLFFDVRQFQTMQALLRDGAAIVCDTQQDPRWAKIEGIEHIRSWLGVSLRARDKVIGVLNIDKSEPDFFHAEDIPVVSAFASHAALAIENARLYQEIKNRLEELRAVYQTSLDITAQLDIQPVLQSIAQRGTELLDAKGGGVYLYEPESQQLRLVAASGMRPGVVGITLRPGEGAAGQVVQTGEPLIVDDYRTWPGRAQIYAEDKFTAVVQVPLKWQDRLIGVLSIHDEREGRRFGPDDVRKLSLLANHAAIALENARLYAEARRQAEELNTLFAVGRAITSTLDLPTLLQQIMDAAVNTIPSAEKGTLHLFDASRDALVVHASVGFSQPMLEAAEFRPGEGYTGKVFATRQAAIIDDVHADPRTKPLDLAEWQMAKSALCVPLIVKDAAIGTITLDNYTRCCAFGENDLHMLTALATHAAIAIENARLYGRVRDQLAELQKTQEQLIQSARLAAVGEFAAGVAHEVNNPLTVVQGTTELLLRQPALTASLRQSLERIQAHAQRIGKVVREFLDFAHQPANVWYEPTDVRCVVEEMLGRLQDRLQADQVRLVTEFAPDLPRVPAAPAQLHQAFTNIVLNALEAMRTCRQKELRVSTRLEPGSGGSGNGLAIVFQDTGVGIPAPHLPRLFDLGFTTKVEDGRARGMGLGLFLADRIIQSHGGCIRVESQVGQGSTFTVLLPVK